MSYPKLTPIIAKGTTEPRYLEDRFKDVINVKDFGAKGDGSTDDTAALEAAFALGAKMYITPGVFRISEPISIPSGAVFYGDVRFILEDNSNTNPAITIGSNTHICSLSIDSLFTSDVYHTLALVEEGVCIDRLVIRSSNDLRADGIHVCGSNVTIGCFESYGIDRPMQVFPVSPETYITKFKLVSYSIYDYIRGINLISVRDSRIGSGVIMYRSDTYVAETPGFNAFLIDSCSDIIFEDMYLTESGEHALRIGGNVSSNNIVFGTIFIEKSSASAVKINASEKCRNISIDKIVCVDLNYNTLEPAKKDDALRFSHISNLTVGEISVYTTSTNESAVGAESVVALCDVENVHIGKVYADSISGNLLYINDTNDFVEGQYGGSSDITIDLMRLLKNPTISSYIISVSCQNTYCKRFKIGLDFESSITKNLLIDNSLVQEDYFIHGRMKKSLSIRGATDYYIDCFDVDTDSRYISNGQFDPTDKNGSLFIASQDSTYGGTVELGAPGSRSRRGAAFVSLKTGSNSYNTGVRIYTGRTGTSSESFISYTQIDHNGNISPSFTGSALGTSNNPWANIYATTGPWSGSDERIKSNIENIDQDLVQAWGDVRCKLFQYKDAISQKGEQKARMHIGYIAQDIDKAFASKGIDASKYGLFCYDEWEERDETTVIIDKPEIVDSVGNVVEKEVSHTETVTIPAGNIYGVRYTEALVLECAYLRSRISKMQEQINILIERINQLTNNVNN